MARFKPLLLLVPFLLAAGAAPARAGFVTIGSDLSAPATIAQSNPRDWAAWPTAFATGGVATRVPVQGEVALAKLKGRIVQDLRSPDQIPDVVMHVVVLRPQPEGRVKLIVSTEDLPLPTSGDPQQVTMHNLLRREARICVEPGDYVSLATSGGFRQAKYNFPTGAYDDGVAFQMFGRVPGSALSLFEEPAGLGSFQVGDVEPGVPVQGIELLMQSVIGTGPDARYFCRTKAEQGMNFPTPNGDNVPTDTTLGQVLANGTPSLPETKKTVKVRKGVVKVAVACSTAGPCPGGTVTLTNNRVVYSRAGFALAPGATQVVSLKFNKTGLKKLKATRGRVTVKATALTRDGTATRRFLVKQA